MKTFLSIAAALAVGCVSAENGVTCARPSACVP